jgi:amino acid adenylation domain-containing protein
MIELDTKSGEQMPSNRNTDLYVFPMSFAQQRLWFMDQLEPGSSVYNTPIALRLVGKLNIPALQDSINEVIRRHEVLRANFPIVNGSPAQVIHPPQALDLPLVDLTATPDSKREERLLDLAREETNRPFNLARDRMVRAFLFRVGEESHVLLLVTHHIVTDGWSRGIVMRELASLYDAFSTGNPSPLPELSLQYPDFAVWQNEYLQGEVLEKLLSYWKQQLADAPISLELPIDRPRPAIRTFNGAIFSTEIPKELTAKVKALSLQENVTLFMTLLAAFNLLLSRYSGQEEIVVGSPIANRNRTEIESLIGFFVNTLALRTDLSGDPSFRDLLARVKETALGAYAHQDLPFEKLVEELRLERSLSHNPLFQVMLVLQNAPRETLKVSHLTIKSLEIDRRTSKFDLSLFIWEKKDELVCGYEYNTDLFEPATIARFHGHFQKLLEGFVARPESRISDYDLLPDSERHRVLIEWNDTEVEYSRDVCLHDAFAQQAKRTPERIAVVFRDQQISYGELHARSNQMARYLRKSGVGPEVLVGLFVERSLDMLVALLGILKSGGAYVPLDPAHPKERIRSILRDAKPPLVLTQQDLADSLPEQSGKVILLDADWHPIASEKTDALPDSFSSHNLAYVLYTSGSTGEPKGVQIEHRSLVNLLASMQKKPGFGAEDTLLAVTTLSFDIAGLELYLPLLAGGKVVLASRDEAIDVRRLLPLLHTSQPTVMQASPATWRMLMEGGWTGAPGMKILCGGETLPPDLAEDLSSRCAELWNMYGPTETTIWSSIYKVEPRVTNTIPIGRPIDNTSFYILDTRQQPVPVGVAGELYIGGEGLARGYLKRPELTSEKFISDPFSNRPGARLYKTGDLSRYLPDGNVRFLGRADFQVKVHGFRIELGEIETVLAQHPGVQQAVVLTREDAPGDKRLVAYVVPAAGQNPTPSGLRAHLRQSLPEYMVPTTFVTLDNFPLTANGKVDRRALPVPEVVARQGEVIGPRDEVEALLLEIWQKVLNIQLIGVQESFFELGGHSLLAVRLITEIERATGKQIPLATLFQEATVEHLAGAIRREPLSPHQMVIAIQPQGSQPPFFAIVTPGMNALGYVALARHLGNDQPLYRIQGPGARLKGRPYSAPEFEHLADEYIKAMKTIQPRGPYYLGGMCEGARVAFDMARLLEARGEEIALLVILDTWVVENTQIRFLWKIDYYSARLKDFWRISLSEKRTTILKWLRNRANNLNPRNNGTRSEWPAAYWPGPSFVPPKFGGNITVLKTPKQPYYYVSDPLMGWGERTTGKVELQLIDVGTRKHILLLREPYVRQLAEKLVGSLRRARARDSDVKTAAAVPR